MHQAIIDGRPRHGEGVFQERFERAMVTVETDPRRGQRRIRRPRNRTERAHRKSERELKRNRARDIPTRKHEQGNRTMLDDPSIDLSRVMQKRKEQAELKSLS